MPSLLDVRRLRTKKLPLSLCVGLSILALILWVAIFAPFLAPHPYVEMHFNTRLQAPGPEFFFGTDDFGRDVFSRVIWGARPALFLSLMATAVTMAIGVPLGLIAGYYGKIIDELIMRLVDIAISVPPILLGLLILALTPPSLTKAAVAVGIVFAPIVVRLTRSVTLALAQEEFVTAARANGENDFYIMTREILPNIWAPIIVEAGLRMTYAILLGAALSFLGVGAQPPSSEWGLMISEARPFLGQAPWMALAPGILLCITVIGINLFGDGLREYLDPKAARQRTSP